MLIGTWADAVWAIGFYEKHGFRVVDPDEKNRLLKKYWNIPDRQIETSVVLAESRDRSGSHGIALYEIRPIGIVESPLVDRACRSEAGRRRRAGRLARVRCRPSAEGIRDLRVGTDVILLTWLDRARRDVLAVHPRGNSSNPLTGVFSTRSPDRPNPIGLHRVRIVSIDGSRVQVSNLEAIDGTPIVDVKPVLGPVDER